MPQRWSVSNYCESNYRRLYFNLETAHCYNGNKEQSKILTENFQSLKIKNRLKILPGVAFRATARIG